MLEDLRVQSLKVLVQKLHVVRLLMKKLWVINIMQVLQCFGRAFRDGSQAVCIGFNKTIL
jgi:hypothetical protein